MLELLVEEIEEMLEDESEELLDDEIEELLIEELLLKELEVLCISVLLEEELKELTCPSVLFELDDSLLLVLFISVLLDETPSCSSILLNPMPLIPE